MKIKMRNFLEATMVFVIVLAFIMPGSAFAIGRNSTDVSIKPSTQTVEKGEVFTVSVYIKPDEPIMGASFSFLNFSVDLIHANSVTEDDLFDNYIMFNDGTIDNENGMITNVFLVADPNDAVSDPGSFVDIEFTAQDQFGTSDVELGGVIITDINGIAIPLNIFDGMVTVENSNSTIWSTNLNLNGGGKMDYAIFGEASDGNDGPPPDDYDAPKAPPPIEPYLYAYFDDDLLEPYDKLLKDCRKYPDTNKIWNLFVLWKSPDLDPVDVTIFWDNSFTDCEYGSIILTRFDPFNETWDFAADMLSEESYGYIPRSFGNDWLTDHFKITCGNMPPDKPSNPSPEDGATDVNIEPVLSWDPCNDPDPEDVVTYDVYFDTNSPPEIEIHNQSTTTFSPGELEHEIVYYWKIVAKDNHGQSTAGDIWSFTTKADSSNGGNGGNGGGPSPPEPNESPTADASASDTFGFIHSFILFNGSLSTDTDGYIISWQWDFGDDTIGNGELAKHIYTESESYTITLTVTDDDGGTDTDTVTVRIAIANNVPTKPLVRGRTIGSQNMQYRYTAISTDEDNDDICYIFNWGDETTTTSEFLSTGMTCTEHHRWTSAGEYTIEVQAYDNKTYSNIAQLTVAIDIFYVGEIGYLIDNDSDEIYDHFYNNATGETITVEKQADGTYLIDSDGDGEWDYSFDLESLADYQAEEKKGTPGFELLIVFVSLALIMLWRKRKR